MKKAATIGLIVGSLIGGYVPTLFGASQFSLAGVFGNFIGGAIGIWVGYKAYVNYFS